MSELYDEELSAEFKAEMAAVNLPELLDELDDLRIDAIARDRMNNFDKSKAIPLSAMMERYAAKE